MDVSEETQFSGTVRICYFVENLLRLLIKHVKNYVLSYFTVNSSVNHMCPGVVSDSTACYQKQESVDDTLAPIHCDIAYRIMFRWL